jgi:ribosomal protein S18 acetylase RimI-like enzyme
LNFAVRRGYRRTGPAEELFLTLINRFKLKGETQMKTVTGATQGRAQRFYEKMGAKKVGPKTAHKGHLCFLCIYEVR